MKRDPLAVLMRLRTEALAEARRILDQAIDAEHAAQQARHAAADAIARETALATRSETDTDVERFAAWLAQARRRLARAEHDLADAAAMVAARRAELTLYRAAAEGTQSAIDRRDAAARAEAARAAQREIDEVASSRHGAAPR